MVAFTSLPLDHFLRLESCPSLRYWKSYIGLPIQSVWFIFFFLLQIKPSVCVPNSGCLLPMILSSGENCSGPKPRSSWMLAGQPEKCMKPNNKTSTLWACCQLFCLAAITVVFMWPGERGCRTGTFILLSSAHPPGPPTSVNSAIPFA